MADAVTKLPIKTDTKAPAPSAVPTPGWLPVESLRREIDRLFDSFHRGPWGFPFSRSAFDFELPSLRSAGWATAPAVDVVEKEKEYEITAELPGLDEKNIEVKLTDDMLTIKGEKKEEREEKEKDYHLSERKYGSFTRSFELPETVDKTKIEASFTKGVLTLKLPKTVKAQQSKDIPIKAA
jgi:HSP20 family protein